VTEVIHDHSRLASEDLYLWNEGRHRRAYGMLGSRLGEVDGQHGAWFTVWAPSVSDAHVIGDFNGWDGWAHPLAARGSSGVWEAFVPGVERGQRYKYRLTTPGGATLDKADPFAVACEVPPATASVVWDLSYDWGDAGWMAERAERQRRDDPISIYELHIGSWRRHPDGWSLSYRELAAPLIAHVHQCGFTHVELMPVMEHPFYGSWGYQTSSYFAPSRRLGDPQDLMWLIDQLHQADIGVILDWVPSHFPTDSFGLAEFDGTHLYEHADPRLGFHPDWKSAIFNYGRLEVRSFLQSSANFWLDAYHADGLRVDAVASMLYRDYSRSAGEWIPNEYGGRENIEAITFLRELNDGIHEAWPAVRTYAEESTAWPMVSRPTTVGGLGFDFKWDMGWMHDTLSYLARDPIHRRHHHHEITFRGLYAGNEDFVLPLSHDEVVHGKGSLLAKMPGDPWQQRANLRLLLALQWTTPGKKLLFMGAELAQTGEWSHDGQLDWWRLEDADHRGVLRLVADLNRWYRQSPALHAGDCHPDGLRWLVSDDAANSVYAWTRVDPSGAAPPLIVAVNATPVPRLNYRLGAPVPEVGWQEAINTDAPEYGGSGVVNGGRLEAVPLATQGFWWSVVVDLPPLGVLVLVPAG
jgi:1,4-alpha-glucan branching enzyme